MIARKHFDETPGFLQWCEAEKLFDIASQAPEGAPIIEIGSAFGKSAGVLACAAPASKVYCVDPWVWWPTVAEIGADAAYLSPPPKSARVRVEGYFDTVAARFPNIVKLRVRSESAALPVLPHLVFIDGDHTRLGVETDILIALKLGATVIALHDYGCAAFPDVEAQAQILLCGRRFERVGDLGVFYA